MNVLEAVVLLTTSSEIKSGQVLKFCNQFQTMKYCGLKFIIITNNSDYDPELLLFLNNTRIFQSIEIYDIKIPKLEDIYIKDQKTYKTAWPRLGLTSGPNILFFEAIKHCFKFNTSLFLETDCRLKENCFTVCKNYISSSCDFLISGSKYLGDAAEWSPSVFLFHHLNGVAFYRTGSEELQNLIKNVENFIAVNVVNKRSLSYDVAIMAFIYESIEHNKLERTYYRTVDSKLIGNTFILNYSLEGNTDTQEINKYFPNHVILHSKLGI